MKKKMLTVSLAAALLVGSVFSVSAAGVKDVLSTDYYAGKYKDLKAAYGNDKDAYVAHFLASGAKEGRVMNPILDVAAYRKAYGDLNAAFGDDWDAYVNHYLTVGIKEKRTTGVLFDLVDYAEKNPDLKAAYGDDYAALAYQYVTSGINEGRAGGSIVEEIEEDEETADADNGSNGSSGSNNTTTVPEPEKPADKGEQHTHTNDPKDGTLTGVVQPLNCTTDGYKQYRCNETYTVDGRTVQCSYTWRVPIKAEHSPSQSNQNIYLLHPTCTEAGQVAYTCQKCGEQVSYTVKALGHDFKTDKVTKTASTSCREEDRGKIVTTTKCSRCGVAGETKTELAAPLDHKFSGASLHDVKPTCTTWGVDYGFCDVCKERIDVQVPPTDHNDKDEVVEVYADTYLQGDGAPSHYVYEVKYCRNDNCKIITYVNEPNAQSDPCVDNDKDGACDTCGLYMKRSVTGQVKVYSENDTFIGTAQ